MHNIDMSIYPSLDSPELTAVLRPAHEPLLHVNDALVHSFLLADPLGYLNFLEQALGDIADGNMSLILPPKEIFEDGPGKGDFRVMSCITRNADRVIKTVKVVGTNLAQRNVPDQVTVGKTLLLHPEENYVTHVFDANAFSSIRTGACVALALRLLAPEPGSLVCFGAGRVGFYSAVFSIATGRVKSMHFSDVADLRAESLSQFLAVRHSDVRFSAGRVDRNAQCDVVILATTATDPLCHPPGWGANLVISVGADTDFQHELDPAWADMADLFVDTRDSARFGDLRKWLDDGLIGKEDMRDIFDILRNDINATRPRIFVSTGSALFDNLTAAYLVERLNPSMPSSDTKSSNL